MSDVDELHKTYYPTEQAQKDGLVSSMDQYKEMYNQSVSDPEAFWRPIAESFYFQQPPSGKFLSYNFDVTKGNIFIKWMEGAVTNICYNALDRHVQNGLGDKVAFYW